MQADDLLHPELVLSDSAPGFYLNANRQTVIALVPPSANNVRYASKLRALCWTSAPDSSSNSTAASKPISIAMWRGILPFFA